MSNEIDTLALLRQLLARTEENRELLEEVLEKLADLQITAENSGYGMLEVV